MELSFLVPAAGRCYHRPARAIERISFKWNRLSAGISWSGKAREAMRCEYRELCATPSGARNTQLKRLRCAFLKQGTAFRRLGGLFCSGFVEILA
ncbi:hypothetical protein ACFPB0_08150 [Glycocaulis abyssi]|uniref:Uncharacterized protein n=1 Tax=Glycocaulis abyssi TaxID=1433403 RepID=A0ABV9NCQ0_9PROT